jgi:cytochrome d ubiquinol oxidase subunit II
MDLNTVWFVLVGVLIAGYAVLDGFDLGVGVLHLFAKDEEERLTHMGAIGPVWDGNEVWLLTGGGALFAAFPAVYATVFSGFYLAFMVLLIALIGRAVALEFRHTAGGAAAKRLWDLAFGLGSLLAALLFGVAVGNVLRGVPIGPDGAYRGSFVDLLSPYALLVGLTTLSLFVLHGALYLSLKTEGPLEERLRRAIVPSWVVFVALYAAATEASVSAAPHLFAHVRGRPLFFGLAAVLGGAILAIPLLVRARRALGAFLASSTTIVAMIGLAGVSLYPRLVPSSLGLDFSLTIANAASTPRALKVMLTIALIGMPLVIGYTAMIYWIFRGKVRVAEGHYAEAVAKWSRSRRWW